MKLGANYILLAVLILAACGAIAFMSKEVRQHNQAFADDCGKRGGIAREIDGMLQCVKP